MNWLIVTHRCPQSVVIFSSAAYSRCYTHAIHTYVCFSGPARSFATNLASTSRWRSRQTCPVLIHAATTDQQPMKSSSLCLVTAAKMSAVAILFHAVDKALYSVSVRPPAAMIRCIMFWCFLMARGHELSLKHASLRIATRPHPAGGSMQPHCFGRLFHVYVACWRPRFGMGISPNIGEDLSKRWPNRRAKFHADRQSPGWEIRNRTYKKKQTKSHSKLNIPPIIRMVG